MTSKSIEQIYPLGLASVALEFEDYSDIGLFEDNGIGVLEVTPIFPENKAWTAADPQSSVDLLNLCRKHQVQPESVHSFFFINMGHDMVSPDIEIRKNAIQLNATLFPAAEQIGAKYIVIHLYNEKVKRSADEVYSLARQAVVDLIPYAEKTGVKIAIENLFAEWSIREINTLLDDLNHPLLGICFDTGHSVLYNSVGEELALCGDRLLGLHIHDNLGEKDNHFVPYRGKIDWADFAEGLVKTGYRGPLLIEAFERAPDETREHFIAACAEAHRDILKLIEQAS
jgi:sugar phosphate isomerase/epimerase